MTVSHSYSRPSAASYSYFPVCRLNWTWSLLRPTEGSADDDDVLAACIPALALVRLVGLEPSSARSLVASRSSSRVGRGRGRPDHLDDHLDLARHGPATRYPIPAGPPTARCAGDALRDLVGRPGHAGGVKGRAAHGGRQGGQRGQARGGGPRGRCRQRRTRYVLVVSNRYTEPDRAADDGDADELNVRPVRIFRPAPTTMQSAKSASHQWVVDWDVLQGGGRWEWPLMGWAASADYMQGTKVSFETKDEAIAFCEKQGAPTCHQPERSSLTNAPDRMAVLCPGSVPAALQAKVVLGQLCLLARRLAPAQDKVTGWRILLRLHSLSCSLSSRFTT